MNDNQQNAGARPPRRPPWNKDKLIGAKPPLRPANVWAIRTRLQLDGRRRDLAMFNLAIDSKLRGCDVVAVRVDDIAPNGYTHDRAPVRQKKTGRPVQFEIGADAASRRRISPVDGSKTRSVLVRWPRR